MEEKASVDPDVQNLGEETAGNKFSLAVNSINNRSEKFLILKYILVDLL